MAKPSQVYFTGEVKGESAMKSEGDIGSPIEYEFRVSLFVWFFSGIMTSLSNRVTIN